CSPSSRVGAASRRYLRWIRPSGESAESPVSSEGQILDDLLTDLDTEQLLRWVLMPVDGVLAAASEIETTIRRDIPEFDRAKLRVLIAEVYTQAGKEGKAKQHARELWNNPAFGPWAESILKQSA